MWRVFTLQQSRRLWVPQSKTQANRRVHMHTNHVPSIASWMPAPHCAQPQSWGEWEGVAEWWGPELLLMYLPPHTPSLTTCDQCIKYRGKHLYGSLQQGISGCGLQTEIRPYLACSTHKPNIFKWQQGREGGKDFVIYEKQSEIQILVSIHSTGTQPCRE